MVEEDHVRRQLLEDNSYFKNIIDLVPTSFYFDVETQQKLRGHPPEGDSDQDDDPEDAQEKKGVKRGPGHLVKKSEWKRKKYDPEEIKTVSEVQEELIEAEKLAKAKSKSSKRNKSQGQHVATSGGQSQELKEKLHNKISLLQAKRKALDKEESVDSKKKRRRENKIKQKLKRKQEKQNRAKGTERMVNGTGATPMKSPSRKPIYNKEGKMVFSKFDFSNSGAKEKPSDAPTGKNYKQLLEKVKKQKEKFQKLKASDETAAKEFKEKSQWKTLIQKAEGIKVKDNPELITKALKKKEKRKHKSQKDWDQRDKNIKDKMKEHQDKRKENLQKKKQSKIDKKIKKSRKKGRMLPGF